MSASLCKQTCRVPDTRTFRCGKEGGGRGDLEGNECESVVRDSVLPGAGCAVENSRSSELPNAGVLTLPFVG